MLGLTLAFRRVGSPLADRRGVMDLVALAPRGVVGNEEERERSRGTGMALTGWHFSSLSEALEFEDFSWHFRKVWESVFKKRVPGNSEIVAFFGDF